MQIVRGIPVSPGIVIGRIFVLDDERLRIAPRHIRPDEITDELERLERALHASVEELHELRDVAEVELGHDAAAIFTFHVGALSDKTLTDPMRVKIREEHFAAEYAVYRVMRDWAERFARMPNAAFATKIDDVRDLSARVLRHLIGEHQSRLDQLDHKAVIIASDLTPSQTAGFDRSKVAAFATDFGGQTSHTAIVARALGIPAVVGCNSLGAIATDGVSVIVDGDRGVVVVDPDDAKLDEYRSYREQRRLEQLTLDEVADLPSRTRDGVDIRLLGNIEFADEISALLDAGGEGVGLYRTEFLYLTSDTEPTEEDHYHAYTRCVELLDGRELVIRTVDLGADKYTQEQFETPERNPFLGCRSIRYCLRNLPMFRRQLRAILRASAVGPIKVMFPLITSTAEFRQGKSLIRDVMEELAEEKIPFDSTIKIGMMVEVPSAAILADVFAREVDFFSIGTNDLVQYTLAVDRTNERVADLYNPAHPAVLRLIREVTRAARRRDVPVSCCGESASEPGMAMLLIGMGLRTLSVTASAIPGLKRLIRSVSTSQCERIAKKAMTFDSDTQVTTYLRDQLQKIIPDPFEGRA
ncbi:MAG: phosphoenolpyruvate--protein phosphotransferase [Planctomycetes bacterium]|nr:phosphoenolpyruvate--protein phosphotransferase [Planctomycetota bacterium]